MHAILLLMVFEDQDSRVDAFGDITIPIQQNKNLLPQKTEKYSS